MPRVSDDEIEPPGGDLHDFDPESFDADFGILSHLDGATFFAQRLRFKMHEVAAIMHLSGMFDVSEAAVAQVIHNYGAASLEALFRNCDSKLASLEGFAEDVVAAWSLNERFDRLRRHVSPNPGEIGIGRDLPKAPLAASIASGTVGTVHATPVTRGRLRLRWSDRRVPPVATR